jgi:hypothetical protein
MRRVPIPTALLLLVLVTPVAFTGCGGSKHVAPVIASPRLPADAPGNTAPDSTVFRLLIADQYLDAVDYDALVADDFHYRFSAQSDPNLVGEFGGNWDRAHETLYTAHLVQGFRNSTGTHVPPVESFVWFAAGTIVSADSTHADSTAWYQDVKVPALQLELDVTAAGGGTLIYSIEAPFVFHLVRGDAAVLGSNQSNASTRWYLRGIDDLSPPFAPFAGGGATLQSVANTTWGQLRGQYYN